MLDTITKNPIATVEAHVETHHAAHPVVQPGQAAPTTLELERRRPGRNNDASPELIALMRKPTAEARLRVMLYDAPNFVLPDPATIGGRTHPYHVIRMVTAIAACSLVWAVAFRAMMMLWG